MCSIATVRGISFSFPIAEDFRISAQLLVFGTFRKESSPLRSPSRSAFAVLCGKSWERPRPGRCQCCFAPHRSAMEWGHLSRPHLRPSAALQHWAEPGSTGAPHQPPWEQNVGLCALGHFDMGEGQLWPNRCGAVSPALSAHTDKARNIPQPSVQCLLLLCSTERDRTTECFELEGPSNVTRCRSPTRGLQPSLSRCSRGQWALRLAARTARSPRSQGSRGGPVISHLGQRWRCHPSTNRSCPQCFQTQCNASEQKGRATPLQGNINERHIDTSTQSSGDGEGWGAQLNNPIKAHHQLCFNCQRDGTSENFSVVVTGSCSFVNLEIISWQKKRDADLIPLKFYYE